VLTRLALLGATPPGMPVLKSLSDLRQLVAAAAASSGGEWIAASIPEATPQGAQEPTEKNGGAVAKLDEAKLREALAAAGASDDETAAILASAGVVASQPEPPQPAPDPTPDPAPQPAPDPTPQPQPVTASGTTVVLASSVWEETQNTIKRLSKFVDETKRNERDAILASAVEQGKFFPSQKDQFARLWDADPDGTRQLIDGLTPNSALAVAASGYADLEDKEFEREFAGLFPPDTMGGRRG